VTPRETTARFAEGLLATRVLAQRVSGASRALPQRPDQIGSADEDRAFDSDLATTQGYRRTVSHRQLDGLPGKRLSALATSVFGRVGDFDPPDRRRPIGSPSAS
jgi:hypothetical protein